jgi:hypothetical protein
MTLSNIINRIFSIDSDGAFDALAMEVFAFQYVHNAVYKEFCDVLKRTPANAAAVADIPFLPVELFKTHRVVSFEGKEEAVFLSSGTTSQQAFPSSSPSHAGIGDEIVDFSSITSETNHEATIKNTGSTGVYRIQAGDMTTTRSKHFIKDLALYRRSFSEGYRHFYGDPSQYCILALLPSYLERDGSSLVFMVDDLIRQSGHPDSGFYLHDIHALSEKLVRLAGSGDKVLLLGVSFGLLDLAETHPTKIKNTVVMETGGMKGRRREMVREELHSILKESFGVESIHSEYGMTELLSQAYSTGRGLFACPPWMRVLIRDSNDPLYITDGRRAGGINIIDLANVYSCSFLATQDLGKIHPGGMFEVLGRFDNSDVRGCNLLVG